MYWTESSQPAKNARTTARKRRAERPAGNPHGPENLAATIYHQLGINPAEEFYTAEGRPIPIVANNGRLIRELL